jgi:hypothetical protein
MQRALSERVNVLLDSDAFKGREVSEGTRLRGVRDSHAWFPSEAFTRRTWLRQVGKNYRKGSGFAAENGLLAALGVPVQAVKHLAYMLRQPRAVTNTPTSGGHNK